MHDWSTVEQQLIGVLKLVLHENGDPLNLLWYCLQVVADEWPADGDMERLEAVRYIIDAIIEVEDAVP